jgi:hypothetical protein
VDFIKDYFLEANPNPERVGCPGEATIKALAEDRLPVSHPATAAHGRVFGVLRRVSRFPIEVVG